MAGGDPATDVLENARRKAAAVAERLAGEHEGGSASGGANAVGAAGEEKPLIIACDTDVVLDGGILGKPADKAEAATYLRRLSGREHEVISALVVRGGSGPAREGIERSRVRFRELDEERIAWYLGTGEWRGRAGGYAIQGFGSALVAGVEGDLSNVIGLPVPVLVALAPEIFAP